MRMLTVRLRTLIEDVLGEIGEVLSELTSFGVRECLFMPLHRERAIYVHSFDLHGSMSNTDQYGSFSLLFHRVTVELSPTNLPACA